jgi:hypothetical protein
MVIFTVTPVSNVLINRRCFKSENLENFFSKVFDEEAMIDVYDVTDKKQKALYVSEINIGRHRIVINDRKFFICKVSSNRKQNA